MTRALDVVKNMLTADRLDNRLVTVRPGATVRSLAVEEPYAQRTDDGGARWVGDTSEIAFLPQLPDRWLWGNESAGGWRDAFDRLAADWDSDVPALKLGHLAQRSERIGMQGWFGERIDPGSGPDRRRYRPELYAATFAWIQAEEAYKARTVARRALAVAVAATVMAATGVLVTALDDAGGAPTSASAPSPGLASPTATSTPSPSTAPTTTPR